MEKLIDGTLNCSTIHETLHACEVYKQFNLLKLLSISCSITQTRILLLCNWCSSEELCKQWNKMSKGDYTWNNIQIVYDEPADYYCVINKPPDNRSLNLSKTILFRMEPYMEKHPEKWSSEWANPKETEFLYCGTHSLYFNNIEWHLSKTYEQLVNYKIVKDSKFVNILSTVLSDKYLEPGQQKRVDFVKFLENKGFPVEVYGGNRFLWKNYKGFLPYHQKDKALFPYKYTFNAENNSIKNYCTEKLWDGILSECLVFYHGCYNVKDLIDEKAFVYLELSNFEKDFQIIKKAIEEDWWSQRIDIIRKEKKKILTQLQFFPRLETIISKARVSP